MGILKWGKPTIQIGKLGANDAVPSSWITIDNPVEDSTKLTTNDGDIQEARGEGGEIVDFKKKKNSYEFAFELFVKQGVSLPVQDVDGVVDGFYAMRLLPEDASLDGIQFAKAVITAGDTYNAADGQRKPYVMHVINSTTGASILPYSGPSVTYTVSDISSGSPKASMLFERCILAENVYVYRPTLDTVVDSQKTYYVRS